MGVLKSISGLFKVSTRPCRACAGMGRDAEREACPACAGSGLVFGLA